MNEYKQNKVTARDLMFYLENLIESLHEIDKTHNRSLYITYTQLEVALVVYEEDAKTEEDRQRELNYINQYLNEIITLINQKLIPQK